MVNDNEASLTLALAAGHVTFPGVEARLVLPTSWTQVLKLEQKLEWATWTQIQRDRIVLGLADL